MLPPAMRSETVHRMDELWRVTCPGCGLAYWTNRKSDLCTDCEKKDIRLPDIYI